MARRPKDMYPGQIDETDVAFPHGKAQDDLVFGDGFGTPLQKAWLNELFGFQQALLTSVSLAPSGLPETATSSQYLQAFYRLIRRADGWGAVGDDSTDDTAALQAGLDAVAAYSSGRQAFHLVAGKTYRVDGLSVPPNVNIFGNGAKLSTKHGSNALLTYAGAGSSASRQHQQVRDITFTAAVANTGATIRLITNFSDVLIFNASFGASSNCQGKFIDASAVASVVRLEACHMQGRTNVRQIHIGTGTLILRDVEFVAAATSSANIVDTGSADVFIDECNFALDAHASGALSCVAVTGAGKVQIGTMRVTGGLPADYCISWVVECTIQESGLHSSGNAVWYGGGGVTLAQGSRLSLRPHRSFVIANNTCPIPGTYLSVSIVCAVTGVFQFQFPVGLYPGQPLTVTGRTEDSGSAFAPTIGGAVTVNPDAAGVLVINDDRALSGRFLWIDPTGGTTYRWVQVDKWVAADL